MESPVKPGRFTTLDKSQFIVRDNLYTMVPVSGCSIKLEYILALLNSSTLNFYYQYVLNPEIGEALAQVKKAHLVQLPVRPINFDNPDDAALYDQIVGLVSLMLDLHEKKAVKKNPETLRHLKTRITTTNHQIDQIIYDLYALTEAEITLVEQSGAGGIFE